MFCVGFMTEYPPETLAICWKITTETFEWNSNASVKIFIDTNRIWNMHGSLRQNVRGPSLRNRILEVPKTPKISACGGLSPLTETFCLLF